MSMIIIKDYGNATPQQIFDLDRAVQALNFVWGTQQFKDELFKCKFMSYQYFANTGMNPHQIWDVLQSGDINIRGIHFYTPSWWQRLRAKISGWIVDGAESSTGISINNQAWAKLSKADRAAFIAHEACHACGFTHDFQPTFARPFSVPYQVERIITALLSV